jgi:N6-adenosine-specific RNA methylase IME4
MNPKSEFEVILADPPWHYNWRGNLETRFRGGACQHYSLMSIEAIEALPVGQVAARDAVLFLWGTFPKTEYALRAIAAWGFTLKTCGFLWEKVNADGSPFFGVGYYSKSNAEPCWLATRGRPLKPASNSVSSLVRARRGGHSEKPEEVARRIERMYPNARKLELFGRRSCPPQGAPWRLSPQSWPRPGIARSRYGSCASALTPRCMISPSTETPTTWKHRRRWSPSPRRSSSSAPCSWCRRSTGRASPTEGWEVPRPHEVPPAAAVRRLVGSKQGDRVHNGSLLGPVRIVVAVRGAC